MRFQVFFRYFFFKVQVFFRYFSGIFFGPLNTKSVRKKRWKLNEIVDKVCSFGGLVIEIRHQIWRKWFSKKLRKNGLISPFFSKKKSIGHIEMKSVEKLMRKPREKIYTSKN